VLKLFHELQFEFQRDVAVFRKHLKSSKARSITLKTFLWRQWPRRKKISRYPTW